MQNNSMHDLLAYGPLLMITALVLTGCKPQNTTLQPSKNADHYFEISLGELAIQLQLALTPEQHAQGLMFRERLPHNHGMCFIFQKPAARSFWMQNTSIPLDIGYFNTAGELIEIHRLYPYDETGVPSQSQQILIAIEMQQGWFAQNKIKLGARLDLAVLQQALILRGGELSSYYFSD